MKLRNTLILLGLTTLITGCGPAVMATATTAGAVVTDPRGTDQMFNDSEISHNVNTKISQDQTLAKNVKITATTYNGDVLLTGEALGSQYRDQAVALAKTVPGVKLVYNNIVLAPLGSFSQFSDDTWLTTKVKAKLYANLGFSSNDFKVVSHNGTVYLMGKVNKTQADLAVQSVEKLDGVKHVKTFFQYSGDDKSSTSTSAKS